MSLVQFITLLNQTAQQTIPPDENQDDGLWHDSTYFAGDDGLWHDSVYFDGDDGFWHDDTYF